MTCSTPTTWLDNAVHWWPERECGEKVPGAWMQIQSGCTYKTIHGVCVPLSLLFLYCHSSLMAPLLFDAFRLVSPPGHTAVLCFLLHNVVRRLWTAQFWGVGFTLRHAHSHTRAHTHTILKCIYCIPLLIYYLHSNIHAWLFIISLLYSALNCLNCWSMIFYFPCSI